MFPVYPGMNAYPYQRNQVPSTTYYHPSWETVPSQLKDEPPSSKCTHESWPHNYGYPVPMQCHNCCSHGQHPAYYDFRPPCSHFPPPPPPPSYNQFYGGFPPYPQSSYPMYYAPPPHYPIDPSRYEYDKCAPRDQLHCCGCPNHSCHGKGRNNVKIEEQEPDVETKRSEPLFPAGAKNLTYPIVWVPPEFTMNKEQPRRLVENEENEQQGLPFVKKFQMPRKSIESQAQDNKGSLLGKKPQGSVPESGDPNLGYRWFPLDTNSIKQLMERGDVKETLNQEKISGDEKTAQDVGNKDQNKQLSYPIIWVPYDKLLKDSSEGQAENPAGRKAADKSAATSNDSPANIEHPVNEEGKERTKPGNGDGRTSTLGAEKKSSTVRTIPVKQLGESAPKLPKKEVERKPSSPTKKPKLPPICLRVDPPKKKDGNGSSRSPSPPGDKKRLDSDVSRSGVKSEHLQTEIKVKDAEEKTPHGTEIKVSRSANEADGVEKKVMQHDIISNSGDVKCGDDLVQARESQASEAGGVEIKALKHDNSSESRNARCGNNQVQARESQAAKESEVDPECKQKRKVMSKLEAAVIIQSAYRGYSVKRSEPLKKLKLIANIREEAIQVKKNIEDLDSRDDVVDDKVKTIIGETIMKLLLKLDTIQGLHESIRDVRRSLAKELTLLQEKLDSMMNRKSKNTSTVQASEATPRDIVLVEASEGTAETIEDLSIGSRPNEGTNTQISDGGSNESSSNQLLPCHNEVCGSANKVTEESLPLNVESTEDAQDEESLSKDGDLSVVEDTTMPSNLVAENEDGETYMFSEPPQEVSETSPAAMRPIEGDVKENDIKCGNQDTEVSQLLELPEQANEQLLAKTSFVEEENDTVVRIEDQEAILPELPREAVEEDKKEMPLAELVMESPDRIKDREADIVAEVSREVVEDDEKEMPLAELVMESPDRIEDQEAGLFSELPLEVVEDKKEIPLAETEPSGKFNDVHQVDERLELANEDLFIDNDHNPVEVSVAKTQTSLEAEKIDNPANFDIPIIVEEVSKLKETTGDREAVEDMKTSKETSNAEFSSRNTTLTGPSEGGSNDVAGVLEERQEENEVEDKKSKETSNGEYSSETTTLTGPSQGGSNDTTGVLDGGQETDSENLNRKKSNVESSFMTSSLLDPVGNKEHVPEFLAGDQQHKFETLDLRGSTEPVVQQSEPVEQQAGQLSEVQSSVTAVEKELHAEEKFKEENEKLKKLLEKLLESGKEQQEVISSLNGKVKDLEKKLAKRKTRSAKHPRIKVVSSSCGKPADGSLRGRPMSTAT